MSQRYKPPPFNLTDYKAKKADEGAVRITAGDREFVVLPPELMDDDTYTKFVKLEGSVETVVEQARMLMGDDEYAAFVEAGGSAMLLLSMIAESSSQWSDAQGASPGESVASSTS